MTEPEPRPVQHPSTTLSAQLLRVTPQVAAVVLAVVLVPRGGTPGYIGGGLLVLALLSVLLTPGAWWQYVRTGVRPLADVDGVLREPGPHTVVLEDHGRQKVAVVKAVREVTGLGLADAKAVVDHPPSAVVEQLSEESAEQVAAVLRQAGATVSVR